MNNEDRKKRQCPGSPAEWNLEFSINDTQLQVAWRAICGWHVGMVDVTGRVVWFVEPDGWVYLTHSQHTDGSYLLPALDSPSNWGHWLVWYANFVDDPAPWYNDIMLNATLPVTLMWDIAEGLSQRNEYVPPEVLKWWQNERSKRGLS